MNQDPFFSIVIANYNYENYVGEAIDSALSQDWTNKEVIVVDDGSTDGSRDVIDRYGNTIIAVFQDNAGQRQANNTGFARSSGNIVIFLDADDILLPGALARIAAVWRPGLSKVQAVMLRVDATGRSLGVAVPTLSHTPSPGQIRKWMNATFEYPTPPGSGNAWSRDFLERIFPLDASCDNFTDSSCIVMAPYLGDVVTLPDILVHYRMHGKNDSHIVARETNFAREVARGLRRFSTATSKCQAAGLPSPDRKTLFYGSNFLQFRVASLRLTPRAHPIEDDSRLRALTNALMVPIRPNFHPLRVRLLIALWSIATILAPRPIARRLIMKRYA